jgi:hypothetical protein
MPKTYTPIATTTITSANSSVTFSSISGTYTDLVAVINGTSTGTVGIGVRFNSDASASYGRVVLQGNGSSVSSSVESGQTYGTWGLLDVTAGNSIIHIMNYANTTTFKNVIARTNLPSTGALVRTIIGTWRSTAAITSVTFMYSTFNPGTTLTLYGIKAA